jgi:hypothetical protein
MRFTDDLVIDTFKYNVRPNFYLPIGASAIIKCTNWKGTEVNDNGVIKQSLIFDVVQCNGQKVNAYLQVYDQLCEDFAGYVRVAIIEKRAHFLVRITNNDGVYSIEDVVGNQPTTMPENNLGNDENA